MCNSLRLWFWRRIHYGSRKQKAGNPELAKLQTKQNYSDVLRYFTGLINCLIRQGVLAEDDPEIMAAQFCLPISVWINL